MEKKDLEASTANLERRLGHWLRVFEKEHEAKVLAVEIIRSEQGAIVDVNMLVR